MTPRARIFTTLGLIGALLTVVLVYLLLRRPKPPAWTPENSLIRATVPSLDDRGKVDALLRSLDRSLLYLESLPPGARQQFGPRSVSVQQLRDGLTDFRTHLQAAGFTEEFFRYVRDHFSFYRTAADDTLVTGYYEPRLHGALEPSGDYRYPLYGLPDDLISADLSAFPAFRRRTDLPPVLRGRLQEDHHLVPYYTRSEIDRLGALKGRGLEIAWIDDPVAVFFLHIQGSGVIELPDGGELQVSYAGSNGQPYRAIGRVLVDEGHLDLEDVSMQRIRDYLRSHPADAERIMDTNPSYVFFRTVTEGPVGALGQPLTAYRSIATDSRLFPRGALCFLATELPAFDPDGQVREWIDWHGFLLNQDTGGAIRGAGRVDLFTGHDPNSEQVAGHLRRAGTLYFLLPNPDPGGRP